MIKQSNIEEIKITKTIAASAEAAAVAAKRYHVHNQLTRKRLRTIRC
jgi:hypothetical protein